jgi:DNA repair ATPase RecN
MTELEMLLNKYNREINECDGTIKSKTDKISEKNKKISELTKEQNDNLLKKTILIEACKRIREMSSDIFADISTSGIRTILGDGLSVKIVHGERNGVPTSDFKLCSTYDNYYTELEPTDDESGGGVADIVSLSNFLTMNILHREENSAPIILDEPTKFVSRGNADKVGEFINNIAKQFDKQIIVVTHAEDTAKHADKLIHVEFDDRGVSVVTIKDPDMI